ncbi:MAG TPA: BON domain-containing protein [Terriglobales bacterium]|nr:BON domain-containing protein [Terriglobales bacterium]
MKPKTGTYVGFVLLVSILAIGVACTKVPADEQVTGQIQSKFSQDSGLQGKPITVQTSGGVVTLSGTVDNEAQRTAAARYASETPGIKQVVNNLQTTPAAVAPAASAPDDAAQATPPERARPVAKPKPSATHRRAESSAPVVRAAAAPAAAAGTAMAQEQSTPAVPAAAPTPPPPAAPKKVTIPSGTTMAIRLVDAINSETAQPGQTFRATLDSPLATEGDVAIPSGYDLQGHVVNVKSAGKFAGKSELVLQLDRISVGNKSYSLQTDQYRRAGNSRTTNTAEKVGAGAVIGAIIGGIAGGGKGAGIGAAAGGGLGGGVQAAGKGQQINLPTESVLNFTLQAPLTVTQVEGPNSSRKKLETPQ